MRKATHQRHRWLVTVVGLLLTACPPPLALVIYNSSGEDLSVLVGARRLPWADGSLLRVSDGGDIDWDELHWENDSEGSASAPVLIVESRAGSRRYRLAIAGLPDAYVRSVDGRRERYLQLERDGFLYALKSGTRFPANPIPPQPPGLPIAPAGV